MKRLITVLALAALALPAHAQMKGMDHGSMATEQKGGAHKATGVVTRAAANGKVTIKHDPIPSLKWPTMTMGFAVRDKAVADKLKAGAKIEFEFVQDGRDYVVTSVK